MFIHKSNAYTGPSVFALVPVVRLVIQMEDADTLCPADVGGDFIESLVRCFPFLAQSTPDADAFAQRLRNDRDLRLSSVVARVALELQRLAKISVSHASAGAAAEKGYHQVLFGFQDPDVGSAAGRVAVDLVNRLANRARGAPGGRAAWQPEAERDAFVAYALRQSLDISAMAIIAEAARRGIPWWRPDNRRRFVQFGYGKYTRRVFETVPPSSSAIAASVTSDKSVTNKLLLQAGVPVPDHVVIGSVSQAEGAIRKVPFPVVIKPMSGRKGQGVRVAVDDIETAKAAINAALQYERSVLVESYIEGADHRILVVGGKMVAAAKRIPGHVVGNGQHTIRELIDQTNLDPRRGVGYEKVMVKLELDDQALSQLALYGFSPGDVPGSGQVVYLRKTANISTGGTAEDVTGTIHPDNKRAAEMAARVLGVDVAGVDFLTPDISRSYMDVGGGICEVNMSPGLRPHWLADPERDVVGPILDLIYPAGQPTRIPIAAITGTDGKTTTTLMVERILREAGRTVGCANTDGTLIDGEWIYKGDIAGYTGTRMVLMNPTVDTAVLECARRGMIHRGVMFDWCDVGAVLNIRDDHVGLDGVQDLDDMARVKGLIARVTRGTLVLNADDARCRAMADTTPAARVCLVSEQPDGARLSDHMESGGPAVWLEAGPDNEEHIVYFDGEQKHDVVSVREIPATWHGVARHNVQNALFAVAVAAGMDAPVDTVRNGLRVFSSSYEDAPGRLNIYGGLPFKVIVDYAHNAQELAAIDQVTRGLDIPGRRIMAFNTAGNRTDRQIRNVGSAAATFGFDHYICFSLDDRRGRAPEEVPALLKESLLAGGIGEDRISAFKDEVDAVAAALAMARPGDLVALLSTDHHRTWQTVTGWGN